MGYIIENVHLLKGGKITNQSLLVENNKISAIRPSFHLYKHLRMNADDYMTTPTHTFFDDRLPFDQPFTQRKNYYLKEFILKGCTTILTYTMINIERELTSQIKKLQSQLLDCPIDYVIGVRIRPPLLTPSFMRACKKVKIPAIFVEVSHLEELENVPWGWVKEAQFPYNSPFIPIFLDSDPNLQKTWVNIMSRNRIPSISNEIHRGTPLSREIMEKVGILPLKSNLHDGGEVSYNFYLKDNKNMKMIESELFMNHDSNLLMTVHKGKVIRAGQFSKYYPGHGEYVRINKPAFYLSHLNGQ